MFEPDLSLAASRLASSCCQASEIKRTVRVCQSRTCGRGHGRHGVNDSSNTVAGQVLAVDLGDRRIDQTPPSFSLCSADLVLRTDFIEVFAEDRHVLV